MKIIILNGPPHCGKDTIGALLRDQYPCTTTSFKHDLYRATADWFLVDVGWLKDVATNRELKDKVHYPSLGGRTPRQALIFISEEVIKPKHGKDFFGQEAVRRINKVANLLLPTVVFTDGGFEDEVWPLHKAFDVTIVHLMGRGTFEHDSRDYIMNSNFKHFSIMLEEGNPQKAVDTIKEYLDND